MCLFKRLTLLSSILLLVAFPILSGASFSTAYPYIYYPTKEYIYSLREGETYYDIVCCKETTPDISCLFFDENNQIEKDTLRDLIKHCTNCDENTLELINNHISRDDIIIASGKIGGEENIFKIELCASRYQLATQDQRLQLAVSFSSFYSLKNRNIGHVRGDIHVWYDEADNTYILTILEKGNSLDQATKSNEFAPCTTNDLQSLKDLLGLGVPL